MVLAVKLLPLAKSRLRPLTDLVRADLALAFAADALDAALDCPVVSRVVLVTSDPHAAATLAQDGVLVVADPGGGLDAAFVHGAAQMSPTLAVAAVTADLPCLRPGDLTAALGQVHDRAFVADTPGTGTTLLAAAAGRALLPAFGPGSASRHEASGAVRLSAPATLARDVDTWEDLQEALGLGVGRRTVAVVAGITAVHHDARG